MKKTLYVLCSAAMALLMAMPTWAADPQPDQFTIVNHRLCEGDSLLIRDGWKKIKETTVFWETLKSTVTGEDSMIKHVVNVLPTYRHVEEKTIKDGETYMWNGQSYNQQGEYTYPLKTVEGCDSICVLRLIVTPVSHPIPFVEESGFVCQPEGYLWRGVNRYVTGTYYDTVHNVSGEDTIYCLRLQAYPVYETFQPTMYFCDGDSLTINGQVFKQSGEYRDTVKSIHGCDSILIYPINKYPAFHYNEERTIQMGDMLLWHGQSLQSEGTYYDKQQTIHGCDSIYILLLHVNPATRPIPLVETFAETCRQEGYVWRNKSYYSEGIYYDTVRTDVGEDTIYCLHLTIYPTYEQHQTLSFCQGGSIEINGHIFTQPGEYRDTVNTIHGCDSIIIYHLNTYPIFQHTEEQTIQAGDVLIWRGQTLQSEGTYYDKYQTIYGCDSIYTLILHVNPAPRPIPLVETFAGTCKQEGYEWRDHLYFNDGVYYDTIKTGTGEDTIYCLHLTVYPTYELHQTLSFCQGSSLEFRGKKFTEPGEYRDTLNSIYGCDSIIIYHINTYPTFHQYDTIVITDQDQRTWHGQQITESKTYYDSYTDIHGCDSVYQLYAIVLPTYHYVLDTTICKNALPFLWRGQEISAEGTYTQKYESIYHTDSIYILNLTVHPTYWSIQNISFCEGGEVTYAGKTYHQAGKDTLFFESQYGCDSIVEVIVSERKKWMQSDTLRMSNQESRDWHGYHITKSGTYYDRLTNVDGCDSVYELVVYVFPTFLFEKDTAICQSEAPYLWQGMECSRLGTHTYDTVFKTIHGLDSIYRLTLTIWPEYEQTQQINLCQGGWIELNGHLFTEPGIYKDTLSTIHGCDSVIIYHVNILSRFYQSDTLHMSNQETKLWRGQTITTSGTYYDRYNSVDGCDSIYELVVFVYPTFVHEEEVTICQSEAPYLWHGMECDRLGTHTYEQVFKTIYGLDSIYRLTLTIWPEYEQTLQFNVCEGSYIEFEGNQCVSPGQYDFTLKTIHGCDSVIHVIVNSVSSYLFSDTVYINDYTPYTWPITGETYSEAGVYTLPGSTTNGCDSSYQLIIYKYPKYIMPVEQVELCMRDTDSFMWRGNEYNQTGVYYDSLFTEHGQDSIYTLNLVVHPIYDTIINATICYDAAYLMNGKPYTASGTYQDILPTVDGCDSVFTLNLTVLPQIKEVRFDTICETALPYTFYDQTIWTEGTYTYQFSGDQNGCNSTSTLHLSVRPVLNHNDSIIICHQDVPYILGDTSGEREGIKLYNDTVVYSCDSLYHFRLHVRGVKDSVVTMCDNDSLWLAGVQRWIHPIKGEVYYDTILYAPSTYSEYDAKVQCDSVVRYIIEGTYPSFNQDTIVRHINEQDSLFWGGQYRKSEGFYYDTLQTAACHCDSIITLHLIVDPIYVYWDSIHICQPHDIAYRHIWADGHEQNADIWQPGTYIDSLRSIRTRDLYNDYDRAYRDSIYVLVVTMDPSYFFNSVYQLCQGDSVQFGSQWIYEAGVYTDSMKTYLGCDSIYRMVVNMTPSYYIREQKSIAQGTIYQWHGQSLSVPGIYYDSLKTQMYDCDSIYELTLDVYPTYHFRQDTAICACETPFLWHGQMIYTSGQYFDRHQTVMHFDSIYELNLQVRDTFHVTDVRTGCKGDSIYFNRRWITIPGEYYDTLKSTVTGCDSIVRLIYSTFSTYFIPQVGQTDDQTPFVWEGHDKQFTQSGIYYDSLKTINGCDSVYQLTLTVYPTYNFQTEYVTICATEAPYYWEHGHENYSNTGTYTKRFATVAGYDSIYTLDLTVLPVSRSDYHANICDGDSVIINNIVYKNGGLFYDTLKATNGCDSIVTIHVTKSAKYFHHEAVSISESELPYTWAGHPNVEIPYAGTFYDYQHTVNGCDSIFEIVVTAYKEFDYSITVCENELPYMLAPNKPLMNSGIYVDTLRNVAGQDSLIRRCKLIVYPVIHTERTVNLCQGSTYTLYNGRVVSVGGNYNDTLQSSVSGCDSIVTIHLSIAPTFDIKQEATIYEGDSVLFEGEWLKTSGLYRKSYTSIYGCDSTIQLNLTVRPIYNIDTTVYICDYELPYEWNGELFYDAGDYTRAKESLVDKVFATLHLIVGASYYEQRTIDICQGDTIAYRNKPYYTSGVFYDTIPTTAGCDSIFQITVRVMKTFYNYLTVNISDKETYVFGEGERARILNKEGTYFNYDKTAEGCDSITELTLHVHPSYFFQDDMDICQNELPYEFHGRQLWETGIYYDSLLTKQGYDSVYMLTLSVHPTYLIEESHDICPDRTTYIHGLNISQPGVYYDSLTTHHGCDSVYKIVVNWRRTYEQEYSAEICQGEAYDFYGVSYTRTGTYKYKIGCDSIIILHLIVHESTMTVFNELVCPEDMPFFFHGKEYEQAGVYCDTFKTAFGCDSIVKLNLTVSDKCSKWNRVPLCKDDTIFILGDTLYQAGEYQFKSRSSSGLVDSIYRIELYNAPVYERSVVDSMCQGDTMWIGDQPITRSGLHHIYLKTTEGCDSIIHLSLTVFPSYLDRTNATIADYQTYNWRGVDYNVTGIYDYVLPTIHNCDSTFRLDLYVVPTQRPTSDVAICSGSTYTWRGRVLSEPGTYTDTILNLASYTSVIYTLNLTVEMPTQIVSARLVQDEVCADDDEVQISFIYNGAKPSNYSILFDSRALKEGFTNIHNQPFGEDMLAKIPLPKRTDPAYLEHANYIRPDMYYLRMVLESQVCGNSQSDTLSFMVRYPSWLLEQNWSDVVALLSSTYNGGYLFSQYDWYVNGVRITNAGNSYLYSKDLRPGDQVYVSATREGENYSITSCPITIVKPEADKYPHPILVYPSSAPKKMPCVTIQSTEDGQFDVYSQTGQAIQHGTVVAGEQIVTMPAVSGCYILKAATKNGQSTTQKIIIF